MFMASVDDYEAMNEQFPLPLSINIGGTSSDPRSYWTHVLHASLLRKFFYGRDELGLNAVYTSIDECIVDLRPGMRDTLDELRRASLDHSQSSTVHHVVGSNSPMGEAELTINDLYGRHLHGDYGRWTHTRKTPAVFAENALLVWNTKAQRLLRYTRQVVDLGVNEMSIDLGGGPAAGSTS
jgi:hypothetical protein